MRLLIRGPNKTIKNFEILIYSNIKTYIFLCKFLLDCVE